MLVADGFGQGLKPAVGDSGDYSLVVAAREGMTGVAHTAVGLARAWLVPIGAVDQQPRGISQTCMAAFGICFATVINANIFGELSIIMAGLGKNEKQFQERVDRNNTAMINL